MNKNIKKLCQSGRSVLAELNCRISSNKRWVLKKRRPLVSATLQNVVRVNQTIIKITLTQLKCIMEQVYKQ